MLSLAVAGLFTTAVSAKADSVFNFSVSGSGTSLTGTLTGTANSNGAYTITGISGTGISGLLGTANPYFSNDNLLFPGTSRSLDVNGIAFMRTVAGSTSVVNIFSNLAYNPPSNVQFFADAFDASGNFTETPVAFAVSAVTPEPSTLLLLGTGVLTLGTQLRRRTGV